MRKPMRNMLENQKNFEFSKGILTNQMIGYVI